MPDPINDPAPSGDAAELTTLRKVNAELLQAKHTLKARVTTLESEVVQLTEKADKATATMRAAVIDLPLSRIAVEVSPVPELWLTEFRKDYNIEANEDGSLSLLTKDGKPVKARDGKPLEFTHSGLYQLLVGVNGKAETERATVFKHIMKYSGAGRTASTHTRLSPTPAEKKDAPVAFGLR